MIHKGTRRIETERLVLRRFRSDDGEVMYRNWTSDVEVTKYLTWPIHQSVEKSIELASMWEEKSLQDTFYQWCIEYKETSEAIGSISVVSVNEGIGEVSIGYCIGKAYWNKGIVTEAFNVIIQYLFHEVDVNRIQAIHDVANTASGQVMKKCGLQLEGIKRKGGKSNSGIHDIAVYAILKEDLNID